MSFKVLKVSRKKISAGDIFVWTMDTQHYYFGRVIKTDANAGGFPHSTLIYIYKNTVRDYRKIPELKKEELLIPPLMTNRQGWLKGYFMNIENKPLNDNDYFNSHIFKDVAFEGYKDEYGNKLENNEK